MTVDGLSDNWPYLRLGGRMVAAIEAIGRGRECLEGDPFAMEL